MPDLRVLAVAAVLLVAGAVAPAQAATPPETVAVHDGRTSAPVVDLAAVRLQASWYWDSEQGVRITVPHGLRAGQQFTVWFDVNGDSVPDGHFSMALRGPAHPGGKSLRSVQEFRVGGGWTHGGARTRCGGSEGGRPAYEQLRRGQRTVSLALDLWSCVEVTPPAADDPGAWRAAVALRKGRQADRAPDRRGWSPVVAGWGPCDPSGGQC